MLSREGMIVLAWAAVVAALALVDVALTLAPEAAMAVNQTTVAAACDTACGRVKLASVLFADGVVCDAADVELRHALVYESAAAAAAAWDAQHPPFAMTRFRPRWAPEMSCAVRSGPLTTPTIAITTILCALSPIILVVCLAYQRDLARSRMLKALLQEHDHGRQLRQLQDGMAAAVVQARQHAVVHPAPPPPAPVPPRALPRFTASMVAAAALARGDRCAVSLDPLDHVTLMVPVCGHVVTEAAAESLRSCPQCGDAPLTFARVPASVVVRVGAEPEGDAEGTAAAAAAAADTAPPPPHN